MGEAIRVFLVDRHGLFREGLSQLLALQEDFCVVGETDSGAGAIGRIQALRPDLVLISVEVPELEGWGVVRGIKEALPDVKVVLLAASPAEGDLVKAMESAADGYLLKDTRASHLFQRLRDVLQGQLVVSRGLTARVAREFALLRRREELLSRNQRVLTARESEVLQLVASGYSNKRIAATLDIGESTVKRHVHNILRKLDFDNRVQVAIYAISEGLAKPASSSSGRRYLARQGYQPRSSAVTVPQAWLDGRSREPRCTLRVPSPALGACRGRWRACSRYRRTDDSRCNGRTGIECPP